MAEKSLIELLKDCGAIKFGNFVLTSGAVSDYYVDIKKASTQPEILREIAKQMKLFTKSCNIIAGMELGAVPLAVALSLETNIPYIIIRKEKRMHGTGKQIEGEDIKNKKVLLVEDVTTSGGSVIKSIDIVKESGGLVDKVITVVDREGQAVEKMKQLEIEFHALITVSEILNKKRK